MGDFDAQIARLAAGRHGVITLEDVRRVGGTPKMAGRRLAAGRWEHLRRGVYRVAGHPPTWRSDLAAAVAGSGEGALASHRSAARLWGIDGFPRSHPEISVVRHHRPDGVDALIHESTDLVLASPGAIDGIPVSGLERTLLDLGAVVPWTRVEEAVDAVLRRRRTDWPALYEVLVRHSRRGRDGCGRLRAVLDQRYGDRVVPDSRFERFVVRLLQDAGLPTPALQHEVIDHDGIAWRLDLAYPRQRIGLELQSKAHHLSPQAFEQDARKRNALQLLGWSLLEFTWSFYVNRPRELCDQVRTSLRTTDLA